MVSFTCPVCYKTKKVRPYELAIRKTCSYACQDALSLSKRHVPRVCIVCGQSFKALRGEVARGKGTCCSHKCASQRSVAVRKPVPIRICETCGKSFKARLGVEL